jgi:glycosyltransferase involved in cell wall biosynthesis
MLDYIEEAQEAFDYFLFVTYLYASTFFGLPLASGKAILIPTAHEEWTLELPAFRPIFQLPELIIYMTDPERQHVQRLMDGEHAPGVVIGVGVNVPAEVSAARFRQKYGLAQDFLIYVGRIDEAKNVPELLDFFIRYQEEYGRELKLVLLGKAHITLPRRPDILPLGFVSEQDKYDALQAATLLLMPSKYESLSIVALEAWLMQTPVLVNGRCQVLKHQCRQSNGGLYYHTYDEFALTLSTMLDHPSLRASMGRQGERFVQSKYDWSIIMAKYQAVFDTLRGRAI